MKRIIASAFVLASFSMVSFATVTSDKENIEVASTDKKEVAITDLPEAVVKTLATEAFKGFKAMKAVVVKGEVDVYEITGTNEDGTEKTVKIDATGKVLS